MNENSITAKVIKLLNSVPGCFARKRHGGMFSSGDPDIGGVYKGRAFYIEMKVTGGKLSSLQADMMERWSAAGAYTAVGVYDYGTRILRVTRLPEGVAWGKYAGPVINVPCGYAHRVDASGVLELLSRIEKC